MKQIIRIYTIVYLISLLNMSAIHSMENDSESLLDNSLAHNLLCFPHDIFERIAPAFVDSVRTCMQIKGTCKKFNKFLTCEAIGKRCRGYSDPEKNFFYDGGWVHIYHKKEFNQVHALILIYSNVSKEKMHTMLRLAVKYDVVQVADAVFKHNADIDGKIREKESYFYNQYNDSKPLLFKVKSSEMAELFINHGADIYEEFEGVNVLWHILDNKYPSALVDLYLKAGVDATSISPYDRKRCLLHHLAATKYSGGASRLDNFIQKAKLLINANLKATNKNLPEIDYDTPFGEIISCNINLPDVKYDTPIDVAYKSMRHIDKYGKKENKSQNKTAILACEILIRLLEEHGGDSYDKLKENEAKRNFEERKKSNTK